MGNGKFLEALNLFQEALLKINGITQIVNRDFDLFYNRGNACLKAMKGQILVCRAHLVSASILDNNSNQDGLSYSPFNPFDLDPLPFKPIFFDLAGEGISFKSELVFGGIGKQKEDDKVGKTKTEDAGFISNVFKIFG